VSCGYKRIYEPIQLPICVACRGRSIVNPNCRISGHPTKQRLEPNWNYTTNTLTTVQKDNYILENGNFDFNYPFNDLIDIYIKLEKLPKYINIREMREFKHGDNPEHLIIITDEMIDMITNSGYRVRKLTPRECYRLMGFTDEYYEKARYCTEEEVNELIKKKRKYTTELDDLGIERVIKLSDAQAYKQAGNSIVVDVLYHVFKALKDTYPNDFKDVRICSLFSGIGAFEQALKAIDNEEILMNL